MFGMSPASAEAGSDAVADQGRESRDALVNQPTGDQGDARTDREDQLGAFAEDSAMMVSMPTGRIAIRRAT